MIDIKLSKSGVNATLSALTEYEDKWEKAIVYGLAQTALAFEAQAKRNFSGTRRRITTKSGGQRLDPPYHKPNDRNFPNVVSGTLRRSITTTLKPGFGGQYVATVSPTVVYARAVELGGRNFQGQPWRNGGYPYMGPAYKMVLPQVNNIFLRAVARRLK